MADQLTTTKEFKIELGYGASGEENVRNIKLPISGRTDDQVADFWKDELYPAMLGKYKWIVQPTGWRDSDTAEEANAVTAATGTIITTSEAKLDPNS